MYRTKIFATDAVRAVPKKKIGAGGVMDGHAHHNSGATCPIPLVYAQLKENAPLPLNPSGIPVFKTRETLEWIIGLLFKRGIEIQKLTTFNMGNLLADLNRKTFEGIEDSNDFCNSKPLNNKGKQLTSVVVTVTMDMERAHIEGYSGQTIYHEEKKKLFYFKRSSGEMPETGGTKVDLSHELVTDKIDKSKVLKLQKWKRQYKETRGASVSNPLHLLPLMFYDPRRYNRPSGTKFPDSMEYGAWDEVFKHVATDKEPGIWLGLKMYPPLGHKPFDELCEYLPEFYNRCQADRIPILTHCSPGGMTTHEAKHYYDYDRHNRGLRHNKKLNQFVKLQGLLSGTGRQPGQTDGIPLMRGENTDNKERFNMDYFFKTYVHPEAWRPVLENFPYLHLCLAHFGGDEWRRGPLVTWEEQAPSQWIRSIVQLTRQYANVYTDISCFNLTKKLHNDTDTKSSVKDTLGKVLGWIRDRDDYRHLKSKVIFGTDWYLTHLTRSDDGAEYGNYCRGFKVMLDEIDPTYWVRFTLVNPWNCYSMSREKIINMKEKLIKANAKEATVNRNFEMLLKLDDEVLRIKERIAE